MLAVWAPKLSRCFSVFELSFKGEKRCGKGWVIATAARQLWSSAENSTHPSPKLRPYTRPASCYDRTARATGPDGRGEWRRAVAGAKPEKTTSQGGWNAEFIKTRIAAPRCRRGGRGPVPFRTGEGRRYSRIDRSDQARHQRMDGPAHHDL